jgi:hypothetical protein
MSKINLKNRVRLHNLRGIIVYDYKVYADQGIITINEDFYQKFDNALDLHYTLQEIQQRIANNKT